MERRRDTGTVSDAGSFWQGLDVALEALKLYLREERGRPDDLLRFARVCRVENVIRPYVEALL